ncbi:MAG: ArsR family transcriptional regulator [Planctomycetaceae bacterium]
MRNAAVKDGSDADLFQSAFCANRLKALGDPLRLRIVNLLQSGELTVGDICEFLEVEIGTASIISKS